MRRDVINKIKMTVYSSGIIKTCRESLSPHVFVAIVSVCDIQGVADIPCRWLRPAVSAVAFQEWAYRIDDNGIMMA